MGQQAWLLRHGLVALFELCVDLLEYEPVDSLEHGLGMQLFHLVTFKGHASLLSLRHYRLTRTVRPLKYRLQSPLEKCSGSHASMNRLIDKRHIRFRDIVLLCNITARVWLPFPMLMLMLPVVLNLRRQLHARLIRGQPATPTLRVQST